MRSIGEMARDSGLGVSALRFYDRAGVLIPARVDPGTGYRWYAPEQLDEARLLVRLRRAAMPLADIRLVLAGWSGADTDLVRRLLEAHLRRLEQGLTEARSEFSTLRALLDHRENPMTASPPTGIVRLSLPASALAPALDAVRFAVGEDPELPMLGGVLFDVEGDVLHVVATDRYRLAVARTDAVGHAGSREHVIVPAPLVDAMRALLADGGAAHTGAGRAGRGQPGGGGGDCLLSVRRLLPGAGRRALSRPAGRSGHRLRPAVGRPGVAGGEAPGSTHRTHRAQRVHPTHTTQPTHRTHVRRGTCRAGAGPFGFFGPFGPFRARRGPAGAAHRASRRGSVGPPRRGCGSGVRAGVVAPRRAPDRLGAARGGPRLRRRTEPGSAA